MKIASTAEHTRKLGIVVGTLKTGLGQNISLVPKCQDGLWEPHCLLSNGYRELFPLG
jgi:hypothetical protein